MKLSNKQKEFWLEPFHRWNIKHGGTRTGKTYLDYFNIPRRIRERMGKEGLVVLLGNTKGTLQRNIIEPMQQIFGAKVISDIRSDNTARIFGEKVYCLGADNVKHVDRIRGSSIKYCYGDEITTWNEEVFQMLKSRLDKPYSCFDATCNPKSKTHWVYKFLQSDADIFSQSYALSDNPFLDDTVRREMEREHTGVFYDRYILGLWVAAEGCCYPVFASNKHLFVIDKINEKEIMYAVIGVDFGGNKSAHSFTLTGYTSKYQQVVVLDEWYKQKEMSPSELERYFVQFVRKAKEKYRIYEAYCDSAETTLIKGLQDICLKEKIGIEVKKAIKGAVNDRIHFYNRLMAQGRFKILKHCVSTIEALENAVYDSKHFEDKRLDDGTTNIDSLDSMEYSTESMQDTIIQVGRNK